jgi:hypothetical protein
MDELGVAHAQRLARRDALCSLLDQWDAHYGPVPAEQLRAAEAAFAEFDCID